VSNSISAVPQWPVSICFRRRHYQRWYSGGRCGARLCPDPGRELYFSGSNVTYWLYAHAHEDTIDISDATGPGDPQPWTAIYTQRWTSPKNGIVSVSELEVGSTGECINMGSDLVFYLDSCVKGDNNELFWEDAPGGIYAGYDWFINAAASDTYGKNYYMTISELANDAWVGAYPAGHGYVVAGLTEQFRSPPGSGRLIPHLPSAASRPSCPGRPPCGDAQVQRRVPSMAQPPAYAGFRRLSPGSPLTFGGAQCCPISSAVAEQR